LSELGQTLQDAFQPEAFSRKGSETVNEGDEKDTTRK
jgi:hypothetical protein